MAGGDARPPDASPGDEGPGRERPPIGFWLIVVLAAFYLGVRLVQGVAWVIDRVAG